MGECVHDLKKKLAAAEKSKDETKIKELKSKIADLMHKLKGELEAAEKETPKNDKKIKALKSEMAEKGEKENLLQIEQEGPDETKKKPDAEAKKKEEPKKGEKKKHHDKGEKKECVHDLKKKLAAAEKAKDETKIKELK